jgi:hypothetical protein
MKYFNFTYPLSLLSPLSYENFCEKLETNDYIHLVGPECDKNLDIEKHINNLTKLFNNKIYNIDQIIFHCPTLPSNELITIDIDGISVQRKKPFNVDFNNLDRIYDKIKNINPVISSKLSYNDIDFEKLKHVCEKHNILLKGGYEGPMNAGMISVVFKGFRTKTHFYILLLSNIKIQKFE